MANEEQLAILKQGVKAWNEWRERNPDVEISLFEANLTGANLKGVDLTRAYLRNADLTGAILTNANFTGANLIGAYLRNADLTKAVFARADLRQVNLQLSHLVRTVLTGSNLSGAWIGETFMVDLDLGDAMGLEDVIHAAPSHISIDTLPQSKGRIPDNFLRGCGLSDWEIAQAKLYNPDLSNKEINDAQYKVYDFRASQAIQISPLFISYSHSDREFVNKIDVSLTQKGVRFWRDIHDMKAGRIEKQIDRAISQTQTVLLVLSKNSLNSDWVEHEVRTARQLGKDIDRDVLCPIALDDSWKSSRWPARVMEQITEYNILDFSAWEDDVKFESMFRRLIDGLQLFYKG